MGKRDLAFALLIAAGAILLVRTIALPPPRMTDLVAQSSPATESNGPATVWTEDVRTSAAAVDAAFERAWHAAGVEPVAQIDPLTFARRLSLALAGTVPALEEIRRFEALPAEQRKPAMVATLLSDRRVDDYLAERLARMMVGVEQGPFFVYRRRRFVAWLSDQLRAGQPYDVLVREVIATEGLWTDRPATNFVTVAIRQDQGNDLDETVLASRVARAFLGVRIDCAQCHDHPFAPWKQRDFHALAAYFGITQTTSFSGIRDQRGQYRYDDRARGESVAIVPRVPFAPELEPETGRRRERLAAWLTHRDNRAFARATVNRVWAWMFGQALIEPVDDLPVNDSAAVPETLEILANDFRDHGFDFKRLIRVIAATRVYQLDSRVASIGDDLPALVAAGAAFPVTPLRAEQVAGALLQAGSLRTLDGDSPLVIQFARLVGLQEFTQRFGDDGEDELAFRPQTIPQRLLLLNGKQVQEKTKSDPLNAVSRVALLAPDDRRAIEIVYLTVLSRRPTPEESAFGVEMLSQRAGNTREEVLGDLFVGLFNSTEFLCQH
ncbi:MAG: DUF1549 and DUF1553 domain-containing protein [Pirellulales bacterium]|nr:DUF1549 and DUF1553 domain-containing protein [Pirellulales bacterium]